MDTPVGLSHEFRYRMGMRLGSVYWRRIFDATTEELLGRLDLCRGSWAAGPFVQDATEELARRGVRVMVAPEEVRRAAAQQPVQTGELRRLTVGDCERLVLVLQVTGDDAVVVLVHSSEEFATDRDLVVSKVVAHTTYRVVVQPGLRFRARLSDLSAVPFGSVPGAVIRACLGSRFVAGSDVAPGVWVGSQRCGGFPDAVWEFKQQELADVMRLQRLDGWDKEEEL